MSIWEVYKRALSMLVEERARALWVVACGIALGGRADRRAGAARARRGRARAGAGRLSHHRPVGAGRPRRHLRRRGGGGDGRPARAPPPPRRAGPGLRARHHPADQLSRREGLGRGGAHHPRRHRRAVLELAVLPARAVRGAGRHPGADADRHLHEPDDGADPGGAGRRLRAANVLVAQKTSTGQAAVEQYHNNVYGRVGDVLGNVTVVQSYARLRRRDAGHARDHGRAADRAISGADLVGPAHGADAHRRHDRGGRHLCRRRRAGRAQGRSPSARSWPSSALPP